MLHNLVEITVADRVKLVYDYAVSVQAVERIRVRGERLKDRGGVWEIDVVTTFLYNRSELGALLYHIYGFGKNLFRLILFCSDGVDLRRALSVRDQHIERYTGKKRRFTIFSTA